MKLLERDMRVAVDFRDRLFLTIARNFRHQKGIKLPEARYWTDFAYVAIDDINTIEEWYYHNRGLFSEQSQKEIDEVIEDIQFWFDEIDDRKYKCNIENPMILDNYRAENYVGWRERK